MGYYSSTGNIQRSTITLSGHINVDITDKTACVVQKASNCQIVL